MRSERSRSVLGPGRTVEYRHADRGRILEAHARRLSL
jgi:hypothetical protein